MKLLKGCTIFLFTVITLILLNAFLLLNILDNTFFNSKIYSDTIDQIDITKFINAFTEDVILESLDNPDTKGVQDLTEQKDKITTQLTAQDHQLIKEILNNTVDEGISYLKDKNKETIVIDLSNSKDRIIDIALDSFDINEYTNLPIPICTETVTKDCITKSDFKFIILEVLAQDLDKSELISVFPECSQIKSSNCMSSSQIEDLLNSQYEDNIDVNNFVFEITPEKEQGLQSIRQVTTRLLLIQLLIVTSLGILILLFTLLFRRNVIQWILTLSIIQSLLLIPTFLISTYITSTIQTKVEIKTDLNNSYLTEVINNGVENTLNRIESLILIYLCIFLTITTINLILLKLFKTKTSNA